jgi:hypothetical protein
VLRSVHICSDQCRCSDQCVWVCAGVGVCCVCGCVCVSVCVGVCCVCLQMFRSVQMPRSMVRSVLRSVHRCSDQRTDAQIKHYMTRQGKIASIGVRLNDSFVTCFGAANIIIGPGTSKSMIQFGFQTKTCVFHKACFLKHYEWALPRRYQGGLGLGAARLELRRLENVITCSIKQPKNRKGGLDKTSTVSQCLNQRLGATDYWFVFHISVCPASPFWNDSQTQKYSVGGPSRIQHTRPVSTLETNPVLGVDFGTQKQG